jgi:hypothetical protein
MTISKRYIDMAKHSKRECRTVSTLQREWVLTELNLMAQYTEESQWLQKGKYHEWLHKTDWEKMIPYQLHRYVTAMEPTYMDSVVIDGYLRLVALEENKRERRERSLILCVPHRVMVTLVSEDYEDDREGDLDVWLEEALAEYTSSLTDVKMILIPILIGRTHWTLAFCNFIKFTIRVFTPRLDTSTDWNIAKVSPPVIILFLSNSTV